MSAPDQGPPPSEAAWERLGRLALVLLFVLALAGGIALLVQRAGPSGVEVVVPPATPPPTLHVYLTGAVVGPGVYAFLEGERLDALLKRAGGPTEDADLDGVNLALRLRDEAHIRIPRAGEAPQPTATTGADGAPSRLDLNTATRAQLEALPGIGAVRAAAILEYRESRGGIQTLGELLQVPGIGPTTLEAIADLAFVE